MPTIPSQHRITLANLLAAYEGESNAAIKYAAFAAKADVDGWFGAASLFRAASHAEQIHADNHARVIGELGGEVHCSIHPLEVRFTLDNLKAALAGEQYEIDTMYPDFIAEAENCDDRDATRTFVFAMEADKAHARLYAEAIALIEAGEKQSWPAQARKFYVCPECGYTSETPEEHDRCPVCNRSWKSFDIVQ